MDFFFHIGEQALTTAFLVAGPILAVALFVGLGVSLVQAVTQIQEQTLAFIPKVAAVVAVLFLLGPWMIDEISQLVHMIADAVAAGPR
jgi:flagellar biosynthesis protein FliQ